MKETELMKAKEFDKRIKDLGLGPDTVTVRAARRVLVDGLNPYQAAQELECSRGLIYKMIDKLHARKVCKCCGGNGWVSA